MLAVSSCLLGCDCKYDGGNNEDERVLELSGIKPVIPICPEELGQLPTPRPPAEIKNGDGYDVLDGKAQVVNNQGRDVTNEFIEGAYQALQQVRMNGITAVVFKSRSPSCGKGRIYTGDFSGELKDGDGVTTALFRRNGIKVYSEDEVDKLL